jgi:hypothetical protein
MTRSDPESIPPDFFLAGYPDGIRAAADQLRAAVKRAVPGVIERVRPGWRLIGYDLPTRRHGVYFAWVMPEPVHVHLGFVHGMFMTDLDRRLDGAHLRIRARFVTFEPGDEIPEATMIAFTREAARVTAMSREERFALLLDREASPG